MVTPSTKHPLRVLGLILNVLFPGIGSLILGKVLIGILQIVLWFVALGFALTGVGLVVAIPIYVIVWLWALITAILML